MNNEIEEMEKRYYRALHPTVGDKIFEMLSYVTIFLIYGLCVIYGHERMAKLFQRLFSKPCDAEGNPIKK